MNEPRLVNGLPIVKYIFQGLILVLITIGAGIWALLKFLNDDRFHRQSTHDLEPIFTFHISHYVFLIGSIGLILYATYFITHDFIKILSLENKTSTKIIEKLFYYLLIFIVFLMIPLPIAGNFYAKYQFTQSGYTQCNALMAKNRFDRTWVLNSEDCNDGKLRWILTQRSKNSAAILQEAQNYLRQKHQ